MLDVNELQYERIHHQKELVSTDGEHINGIKTSGIRPNEFHVSKMASPKQHFPLFIKEYEFRFNYGTPKNQLKVLKLWLREKGII